MSTYIRLVSIRLHEAKSFRTFSVEFAASIPPQGGVPRRAQLAILDYGTEDRDRLLQLSEGARTWPIQHVSQGERREIAGEFGFEILELTQKEVRLRIWSENPLHITKGYAPQRRLRAVG